MLYQDADLVVVVKPAGLLVHRSDVDRHETRFLLQALRNQLGRRLYPVHRLDKPTSGLMVFALDPGIAAALAPAFSGGEVVKTYLGVVRGWISAPQCIDYPLLDEPDRYAGRVASAAARPALTELWPLARAELPIPVGPYPGARYSLLALRPRQGRRHQLRRHLKHIFHPLLGDTSHGDGAHNRLARAHLGCRRLLLHAWALRLRHPRSGELLDFRAPPGGQFSAVLASLGWTAPDAWADVPPLPPCEAS